MDISNTPEAVNRTSKYMKKNKGRSANYTLAPYCYQGIPATSSYYASAFCNKREFLVTAVKSDINTEEWRA